MTMLAARTHSRDRPRELTNEEKVAEAALIKEMMARSRRSALLQFLLPDTPVAAVRRHPVLAARRWLFAAACACLAVAS